MPRGLDATSSPIVISFDTKETTINTMIEDTIQLGLNPLDNEVFIVTGIKIDVSTPSVDVTLGAGLTESSFARVSVSKNSRTEVGHLGETNVMATAIREVQFTAYQGVGGFPNAGAPIVVFAEQNSADTPISDMDYLDIVATDNMFIQLTGQNNVAGALQSCAGKIYGYRARAKSGSIYAALVQSELLSN